jgi:hypothetical protein
LSIHLWNLKKTTIESENTPDHTTLALIEFTNDKEFEFFRFCLMTIQKKIININTFRCKSTHTEYDSFWFFECHHYCSIIQYLCNTRRKVHYQKWLKYLAVLFFNVPTITYSAVEGLSYKILFSILFGISFSLWVLWVQFGLWIH